MSNTITSYGNYATDYLSGMSGSSASQRGGGGESIAALLQFVEQLLQERVSQGFGSASQGGTGGGGSSAPAAPAFAMPPASFAPPAPGAPSGTPTPPGTPPVGGGTPTPGSSPSVRATTGASGSVTTPAGTPAAGSPPAAGATGGATGSTPGAQVGKAIAQPPNSLNVADFGAVGNGSTDNTQALQNAINTAASEGKSVYIPPGTYNHSGTLSLNGVNVTGAGSQTVLVATNPNEAAIKLGSNASLSNIQTVSSASTRSSQPDAAAIDVTGANDNVSNVTTLGAASNGIRLDGASNATIRGNLVEGSNADGIALMNGSTNNSIDGNEVYQAGDDAYSDDSYASDGKQDSGNVFSNDLALDNAYGRSFALMGATGDTVKNSVSDGSQWMGIVAGTDSNSRTMNGSNDTITHNLILNAKGDAVDVMGAGGALSQGGAGMNIDNNSTNGSTSSVLGFTPAANLVDRSQISGGYRPGTGDGAHNGS